ncbi:MAG: glycoside hydrolase family 2 protein [Ruminiclostridium sp.]|nr:glycoside hydrolase family 2 protein [Ruminiclostridium sp.]
MKTDLNENWTMTYGGSTYTCSVPCSLYKVLLDNKAVPDPYYRENEYISTDLCRYDVTFTREFDASPEVLSADMQILVFHGIDTLSEVYLNGGKVTDTDNMHREWELDVTGKLREHNTLEVRIKSPINYIEAENEKRPVWGVGECMKGYPHLRKAHCMFGWDWGPNLPDMGIWRDVELYAYSKARIMQPYIELMNEMPADNARLKIQARVDSRDDVNTHFECIITSPDGETVFGGKLPDSGIVDIPDPRLWWVRGLGEQPLYTVTVELRDESGFLLDTCTKRIGLRTLIVSKDKDEWGEEFCFKCNGVKVFAMGANYIPEDQIVTRMTKEKTDRLLEDCASANFNFIRVWGGGIYPPDWFCDKCDELGLIVWQDFMFACSAYRLTDSFRATVEAEIADNIIRLRHHPSLGLWCGNNEIESAWVGWGLPEDEECKRDYLTLFEDIIPRLLAEYDPVRAKFYHPSSPSSGGGFIDPSSNKAGDMHYWDVWHSFKPIEDFRKYYYRFCSEYGFESIPDIKTVRTFAEDSDLDLCGTVMQAHQKCLLGNEKLMFYLAQMCNYPYDFERLIYCTQLVQADCIRSNVEHMRRARGRCMGSAYWQVNDTNPVISWSSIDCYGRWKALHYAAKRFYAPILLSCDDSDPKHPVLYVTNDTLSDEKLSVTCRVRNNRAKILGEFSAEITSYALSAAPALSPDLSGNFTTVNDKRTKYIEYALIRDGEVISRGTTLFVRPKEFTFSPAIINADIADNGEIFTITLTADRFAKSVCLSLKDHDYVFSDNWFDIHGNEPVTVTLGKPDGMTVEKLRKQLEIRNY